MTPRGVCMLDKALGDTNSLNFTFSQATGNVAFLWQISSISSEGRKYQLLNGCLYCGLHQIKRETENLAHTGTLEEKHMQLVCVGIVFFPPPNLCLKYTIHSKNQTLTGIHQLN